jgi:digeranylgeranylglycerophospholipid reductase
VAGSEAALEAAKTGSKVLLLEEHQQVGVPSHCSGVVSLSGLKLMGLEPNQSFNQRLIKGARFHPPKGEPVEVRKPEPVALIVNRMRLDQFLAKRAVAQGAELRTKTRVSKFERYSDGSAGVVLQDGAKVSAKVVVDASGAGSRLPEQAGLKTPDWSELLPGLQYELIETPAQDDLVDLYFGSKRAPGFFAWSIPTGDRNSRVGLASKRGNVKKLLDDLILENWPKAEIEATKSGSVLVSGPVGKCWSHNFLVAGDAAGQVKQTTGGGIVIGGYCGALAGKAASQYAKAGPEAGTKFLREYETKWREMFSSDLRRMGFARRLFSGLSDETMDRLFDLLRGYVGDIEEFGDIDFQGKIISRMLRERKLVKLLPRLATDSLKSIFS